MKRGWPCRFDRAKAKHAGVSFDVARFPASYGTQ